MLTIRRLYLDISILKRGSKYRAGCLITRVSCVTGCILALVPFGHEFWSTSLRAWRYPPSLLHSRQRNRQGACWQSSPKATPALTLVPCRTRLTQSRVLGALPLRSLSRLWGYLNGLVLPVWFRPTGFKLYAWIFGLWLVAVNRPDPPDIPIIIIP